MNNHKSGIIDTLKQELDSTASREDRALQIMRTITNLVDLLDEEDQIIPPLPAVDNPVRRKTLEVYLRIGKMLGRNSPEAVIADTTESIEQLLTMNIINKFNGGRGGNAQEWVERDLNPNLDHDMREHTFNMNIYRSSYRRFYDLLTVWRSRWVKGTSIFYTKSDQKQNK
jgi:hypothetical protein